MDKTTTNSIGETQKLGENLARQLYLRQIKKSAVILGLQGGLGGGKTTFLQGLAKGLGIKEKILSPTFIIYKKFKIHGRRQNWRSSTLMPEYFYHFDCYRLKGAKDILELGWAEIIQNPKNIVAVEWSERIKKILPKDFIKISFEFVDENKRTVIMNYGKETDNYRF